MMIPFPQMIDGNDGGSGRNNPPETTGSDTGTSGGGASGPETFTTKGDPMTVIIHPTHLKVSITPCGG